MVSCLHGRGIGRRLCRITGTGATYANTGDQKGHGVELESAWTVSRDLRLSGNYAWQRSTDQATGTDAGYAPRHHLYGRAEWAFASGYQSSAPNKATPRLVTWCRRSNVPRAVPRLPMCYPRLCWTYCSTPAAEASLWAPSA